LDGSYTSALVRYFTPDTTMDGLTRVTKVVNTAGSAEVAMLIGKTTLGRTQVSDWKFTEENTDHQFFTEFGMTKKFGIRRLERSEAGDFSLNSQGINTPRAVPTNESSFLFMTSTASQSF
jgi:hypothetical protein